MNIFNKARITFTELYKDATDYLSKTYSQAGQLWSLSSAFGQLLQVILELGKLIMYYIEDSITELNINTATRKNSIQGLSRITGHNPMRANSANGNVKITYNGENLNIYGNTVIVPNYTKIKCEENGLTYLIVVPSEEIRLTLSNLETTIVKIIQGEFEIQKTTGTGEKLQSYSFFAKRGKNIDNNNIKVYVNSEEWKLYNSLIDIPYQEKGCIVKTGYTDGIDVFFGNGYNGMIPVVGAEIRVEYIINAGNDGNIRKTDNVSWKFVDTGYDILGNEVALSEAFNIETETNISFGSDAESIELTKLLTPIVSRNFVLANPTNYIYFLEKFNYFSYIDAFTTFDDDDISDDNVIYLFLVPDVNKRIKTNENYFTVPQENFILSDDEKTNVYSVIEESGQKIVTTVCKIIDPIIKRYIVNISLVIFEDYSKDIIRQEIETRLSEYFLKNRRKDLIPKSDLIAIIENIDGVDSVNLWFTGEENERSKENNPDAEDIGIDKFGDIVMERDELVLIRGGWYDRNGIYIEDKLDPNKPSCVNISFSRITPKTYNDIVHQDVIKKIKKN